MSRYLSTIDTIISITIAVPSVIKHCQVIVVVWIMMWVNISTFIY